MFRLSGALITAAKLGKGCRAAAELVDLVAPGGIGTPCEARKCMLVPRDEEGPRRFICKYVKAFVKLRR